MPIQMNRLVKFIVDSVSYRFISCFLFLILHYFLNLISWLKSYFLEERQHPSSSLLEFPIFVVVGSIQLLLVPLPLLNFSPVFACTTLQNERKVEVLNEMQELQERISKEGANTSVQRLLSLLKLLKVHHFLI